MGRNNIRKLDAQRYLVLSTGEVREYTRAGQKSASGMMSTFERLSGLIRTNFSSGAKNQLFITLTYGFEQKDPEILYRDFDKFLKRLRYWHPEHKFDYLAVAEPQGNGRWHMHVMLKSNLPNLFIANTFMEKLWGHGFTDVQRLEDVDDLGVYYVAYFTDTLSTDKKRQKGARISLYPPGMRFYRRSRGILDPVTVELTREQAEALYGHPAWERTLEISNRDTGQLYNLHNKAVFKPGHINNPGHSRHSR